MSFFRKKEGLFESGKILYLPVEGLRPNPNQPRTQFDAGALEELAASIREHGILQPLSVRRRGGELGAGLRGAPAPGCWPGGAPGGPLYRGGRG